MDYWGRKDKRGEIFNIYEFEFIQREKEREGPTSVCYQNLTFVKLGREGNMKKYAVSK